MTAVSGVCKTHRNLVTERSKAALPYLFYLYFSKWSSYVYMKCVAYEDCNNEYDRASSTFDGSG